MRVFNKLSEWLDFRYSELTEFGTIGFVPTMGALHKGHISLVNESVKNNDKTVVSIYVNPTQFDNKEDLEKYPSTIDDDLKILEKNHVDFVILPTYEEIYPDSFNYVIEEKKLSKILCGSTRPGHFNGVLTIVMKLLNIVRASNAYFGEKDFQQYLLIKNMAEAFFIRTNIISCPLIREDSGLALSSRNKRLSEEELKIAPKFNKILSLENSDDEITNLLINEGFKVDYVETIDDRRFGAVFLGKIRLIDNVKI